MGGGGDGDDNLFIGLVLISVFDDIGTDLITDEFEVELGLFVEVGLAGGLEDKVGQVLDMVMVSGNG